MSLKALCNFSASSGESPVRAVGAGVSDMAFPLPNHCLRGVSCDRFAAPVPYLVFALPGGRFPLIGRMRQLTGQFSPWPPLQTVEGRGERAAGDGHATATGQNR